MHLRKYTFFAALLFCTVPVHAYTQLKESFAPYVANFFLGASYIGYSQAFMIGFSRACRHDAGIPFDWQIQDKLWYASTGCFALNCFLSGNYPPTFYQIWGSAAVSLAAIGWLIQHDTKTGQRLRGYEGRNESSGYYYYAVDGMGIMAGISYVTAKYKNT